MIKKSEFYKLLNEGLFNKYCGAAGPIQEVSIVYKKKKDIRMLNKRKEFDTIAVDFIGNFIEEKTIYADLSNPIQMNTHLNNVSGTLFIEDDNFNDLILGF
ncbi:MAG: hypothetical protein HY265_03645 [Deltaproteobacteria bacterium]|nr:hypothetical protein [Candidatus Daviesbacteria bacterium]MBI3755238.1 hypothetical protein [Deltaproteobacteria bacterium]MBI5328430.1 hypothetical protein [Deltaproteobacteria bacterium]